MFVSFMIYLLGFTAVLGGIFMLISKNPITSAMWFGLVLISNAGIYGLLNAHFLALIQVLVYVGAIMVLIVYVIALLNFDDRDLLGKISITKLLAFLTALILFVEMLVKLSAFDSDKTAKVAKSFGKVAAFGMDIFKNNLFGFEIVSILLLVAVVGGIYIAKKD